jgi:flagellar motor switch protein FliN/FliY
VPQDAASPAWLLEEFVRHLASAFETMTGARPAVECEPDPGYTAAGIVWQQPFSGIAGAVWLSAAESDFTPIGAYILAAAGVGDTDPESIRSTYLETLSQALAGLAQAVSAKVAREVTPHGGQEKPLEDLPGPATDSAGLWSRASIKLPQYTAAIHIRFEPALLDALAEGAASEAIVERQPPSDLSGTSGPLTSRTFDLLLDVELPVSVSFGRAQVQLKDVLKLTTGSIVELNRSIVEPVEVIVNNCVIARGEVVVIEGNFGVRIQQVISRKERLRTLH